MPNVVRKGGLHPLEYLDGSPWNGKARQYFIPSSDTNAFAIGDPVTLSGLSDAMGVAAVTLATAGSSNLLLGPVIGVGGAIYGGASVTPGALETMIVPATKTVGYYVLVADDPNIIYEVEEVNSGTAMTSLLASAAGTCPVGLNYNLASGTNTGYVSGWVLDNTTGATSSTRQLQVLGLVRRPDVVLGAAARWKVRINQHQWNAAASGV